jgi:hypothetical protein
MATTNPFESLGLQFVGKERQHMGAGPLGEIAKMIPAGLLGYGLYKSGAVDNLNDMFNPKKTITDKITGAVAPEQRAATGIPPVQGGNMSVQNFTQRSDVNEALNAIPDSNTGGAVLPAAPQLAPPPNSTDDDVNSVIPMISGDPFKRNVAQDMGALQIAQSQPQAPPTVGQEQLGKAPSSDGVDMASIVKLLMAFA